MKTIAMRMFQFAVGFFLASASSTALAQPPQVYFPDGKLAVPMSESSSSMERMTIHIVSASTGEPIEGVQLQFTGRIGVRNAARTLTTNAQGNADLTWSSGSPIPNLRFTSKKAGFAPVTYTWQASQAPFEFPKVLEVKLEPGVKVGGVVRDDDEKPIEGAQIRISMLNTWPANYRVSIVAATMLSDKQGRWQFEDAPSDMEKMNISVTHPDYLSTGIRAVAGMDNIFVLRQGPMLRGSVVDKDGKPVGFARLSVGDSRFSGRTAQTVTDEEGLFQLKNATLGQSNVTVVSDNYAPQVQRVTISDKNEPLRIVLEPGHLLRGRIVDTDGKPIAGVTVATEYFREMQVLDNRFTTDAEGRFQWKNAPADGMKYSIFKQGLMSVRDKVLPANGEEQLITMNAPLVISGRVTDANTGEPIQNFRLQRGQNTGGDRAYWYQGETTAFAGGTYRFEFAEPTNGWLLRASADGYLPVDSREFKMADGKVTFDFALKPGKGPSGVVLLPSGEPAAGAELAIWRQNQYVSIQAGRFGRQNSETTIITTDKEGRFALQPQSEIDPFLLIVLHNAGFADVSSEELAKSDRIKLTAWGQLEGQVMIGAKPDVNRYISYSPQREAVMTDPLRRNFYYYNYSATTDAQGRFRFDRVVPGKGTVSRITVTQYANYTTHNPGWSSLIEIKPGEATKVTIGGTGRPVTGKIVTDREPDAPISWTENEPASIMPRQQRQTLLGAIFGGGNREASGVDPNTRFVGSIDPSGKFTIPDVPAGDYTLGVNVNDPPNPNGSRMTIGQASFDFTVPKMDGGRSEEVLDVGTITAKLNPVLEPGAVAPAVTFPGVDGKTIRTTDFAGKLVLISFVAGERGGDSSGVDVLKRINEQFGKDPNFAMLTVWCGYDQASVKQLVEAYGLKGPQGVVPHVQSRAPQVYMVRALPTMFLVGANGKVISRNPKEDELKKSIDSFLSLGDLYFTGKAERPPAFPIKRFEATEAKLADAPAVVVMDDTDAKIAADQPGEDRVRMLAADGKELSSLSGFNAMQTTGGVHSIAVDPKRGRIYIVENAGHHLTAFSAIGQRLWQLDQVDGSAVAVDEKTGNIWVTGGNSLNEGETLVFDPEGKDVASYSLRGGDIVFDPHADAFWLISYELLKVNRNGDVQLRKRVGNWMCASGAVNPADGSLWMIELGHPQVENSKNRLWLLGSDGATQQEVSLGDQPAFAVALAKDGSAWISGVKNLRHVGKDGKIGEPLAIEARGISVSPTTGEIWLTTKDAAVKIDATGKELARSPFRAESQQAWILAF